MKNKIRHQSDLDCGRTIVNGQTKNMIEVECQATNQMVDLKIIVKVSTADSLLVILSEHLLNMFLMQKLLTHLA